MLKTNTEEEKTANLQATEAAESLIVHAMPMPSS